MNNSTHTRASESGNDPVSNADATRRLFELARRVAQSNCTVLITGESGTGKEVLARHIHLNSPRANAPFIAVNCAAIPEHMLEAMLFGWERGAFTGAHQAHAGKFEQAQGGTLLLDEISEMPMGLQAKLLRVLQEHEVERLGGREPIALHVRVLATSNRRLREEVAAGRFREDLYYRLNVFPLALAPLRGRRDDILPLAMRMLANHSLPGARIPALQADAARLLLAHEWPGNVRELENVMQRALVLCEGDIIGPEHISFETSVPAEAAAQSGQLVAPAGLPRSRAPDLADSLAVAERQIILDALKTFHGSRQRVAEKLGISPRTLRYKLARLRAAGIDINADMEQVA